MLPQPLHPAVVHFPIVLTLLLPVVAAGAWLAVRRGARPGRAWALVAGTAALLFASTWGAVRTGESEEEVVEGVVAESVIGQHEEGAERYLFATGAFALLALAGLARGRVGRAGRIAGLAGALVLVPLAWSVGHSGGELVYRHGAASAYVTGDTPVSARAGERRH